MTRALYYLGRFGQIIGMWMLSQVTPSHVTPSQVKPSQVTFSHVTASQRTFS